MVSTEPRCSVLYHQCVMVPTELRWPAHWLSPFQLYSWGYIIILSNSPIFPFAMPNLWLQFHQWKRAFSVFHFCFTAQPNPTFISLFICSIFSWFWKLFYQFLCMVGDFCLHKKNSLNFIFSDVTFLFFIIVISLIISGTCLEPSHLESIWSLLLDHISAAQESLQSAVSVLYYQDSSDKPYYWGLTCSRLPSCAVC